MKCFKDLDVKLTRRFQGDRIRIEKIEGDEIIVKDFEIKKSKLKKENDPNFNENNECLYLQLEVMGQDRVLWGNYKFLIDQIRQVNKNDLPFVAKIVNDHGYMFK
jgi:hypothetical protein